MNLRFKNVFSKTIMALMMSGLLVACQDTIPNRSLITPNKSVGTTGGTDGGDSGEDKSVVRPTGAIKFKTDFCGCKDGKPVTFGNCSTFCSGKQTNSAEVFYANFNVTEDISLSGLGNVYAWCQTPLPNETTNPKCILEAKDDEGNKINLDVTPITGSNSITASIDSLSEDKTYVLTLIESVSGAKSNSIQIVKYTDDLSIPLLGPLKIAPISQYSCILRQSSIDQGTNDTYFESASRVHFYFLPRMPHAPISGGQSEFFCHDITLNGIVDDVSYPRLELISGVFNLWDSTDPRFYDNNGNNVLDINDVILQKTKNFGGTNLPAGATYFTLFPLKSSPQTSDSNSSNGATTVDADLGYYMLPWIDPSTYKSYCLNSTHYNSSNPLFKALRDIIGVDTEGVYVGEKAPETIISNDGSMIQGPKDYLLVRETDLKKVWFYYKDGVPTAPNDNNVSIVPIYFYYPFNPSSPFIKTSTQRVYQVKGANELAGQNVKTGGANNSGVSTNYPPHDRKIGCIPKF